MVNEFESQPTIFIIFLSSIIFSTKQSQPPLLNCYITNFYWL